MKITKKQIKELHQSGDVNKLKEWYPSVFGELEVGFWYKNIKEPLNIIYLESGNKDSFECYGFSDSGKWMGLMNRSTFNCGPYTKATHQEIETALRSEWTKRIGVNYPTVICLNNKTHEKCGNMLVYDNGCLYMDTKKTQKVFDNGTWATIIKQMTQEQIEKELGYKIEIV